LNNLPAIRAIAAANGANNFTIIVPCHRVIGAKGEMTGYAGGIANKKKLLELENPALKNELGFDFTP
jgi:methylated-DNA-[protein]-cysteine S-methyltransferase